MYIHIHTYSFEIKINLNIGEFWCDQTFRLCGWNSETGIVHFFSTMNVQKKNL